MTLTKLAIAGALLTGCAFNSYADIDTTPVSYTHLTLPPQH